MQFPRELFRQAGLNSSDAANLFDVSRVAGWRWMRTDAAGVNKYLQEKVGRTALAIQRAVAAGVLPDKRISKLPPGKRIFVVKRIIAQYAASK